MVMPKLLVEDSRIIGLYRRWKIPSPDWDGLSADELVIEGHTLFLDMVKNPGASEQLGRLLLFLSPQQPTEQEFLMGVKKTMHFIQKEENEEDYYKPMALARCFSETVLGEPSNRPLIFVAIWFLVHEKRRIQIPG